MRAAVLASLAASAAGRLIVSVHHVDDRPRAAVIDSGSGEELGSGSCATAGDWWAGVSAACRSALSDAGCSGPDVAAIEFHSPPTATSARDELVMPHSNRPIIIEPSVLAADVGSLAAAAREIAAAGATWVHVDITDGSIEAGRSLSSLGPSSVAAVRAAAPSLRIDVHLYTLDPEAHVAAVAAAGADRITFQMETMGSPLTGGGLAASQARAKALCAAIRAAGCTVGVCIAPATPVESIEPLCAEGDVELVDVLSVNPGIGGQPFQPAALDKVRALRAAHPALPYLLVDGGIDAATAPLAAEAGANALVSGSYLFRAPPGGMRARLEALRAALRERGD